MTAPASVRTGAGISSPTPGVNGYIGASPVTSSRISLVAQPGAFVELKAAYDPADASG